MSGRITSPSGRVWLRPRSFVSMLLVATALPDDAQPGIVGNTSSFSPPHDICVSSRSPSADMYVWVWQRLYAPPSARAHSHGAGKSSMSSGLVSVNVRIVSRRLLLFSCVAQRIIKKRRCPYSSAHRQPAMVSVDFPDPRAAAIDACGKSPRITCCKSSRMDRWSRQNFRGNSPGR